MECVVGMDGKEREMIFNGSNITIKLSFKKGAQRNEL